MRGLSANEIDETLDELDHNIKRLRIDYELYFAGSGRREPTLLRGKVQKLITRLVNEPPRNSAQKFRFNTLNARFQSYRQHWGRITREIDAGTYRPHRFRADMRVPGAGASETQAERPPSSSTPGVDAVDKLFDAVKRARQQTGESIADLSREKLALAVRRQTEAIKARHGDAAKVRFRIAIEDGRARLKAAVKS